MSMLDWTHTPIVGGIMSTNEIFPEYEIKCMDEKFFVVRTVAECDDIGPLDSFDQAEYVIMHLGKMLVEFEEQAWRVVAAQNLKQQAEVVTIDALPPEATPAENSGPGWVGVV